ncbi:tetratricopeptide repeat protein [Tumebacillus sp. BK434]|nr:tetratricopeptide repeat protein [Tumebacillus sp. BK434]
MKALADNDSLMEILNRATLMLAAGDMMRAREDVQAGLALDARHAPLLCTLGLIEMAEARPNEAQQALLAARVSDPALLEAHVNLSVLLFEIGNIEGAIEALDLAVKHHPGADLLYFNRGFAKQCLGRWEEAASDFSKALELGSENVEA